MAHWRQFIGYLWASFALFIILATFIGGGFWARKLVNLTGIKVSPWLNGGDIVQIIQNDRYRIFIHQVVFDGLIGQRKQGFVQIDWQPKTGLLPAQLNDSIDYDHDQVVDFTIRFNSKTNRAWLIDKKPYVIKIGSIYPLGHERAIRVLLINSMSSQSRKTLSL
ncbi:MAG TPA: hypothetical protein DDW50_22000 [Firmicutes bacterium]|jgi:hypothetical protein|nr:hypothetical protein [Bacillota bacterium]